MWISESGNRPSRASCRMLAWASVALIVGGLLLPGCGATDSSFERDQVESAESATQASELTAVDPSEPATVVDLFPEGPERSLVLNNCGTCHAVACSAIGQRTPARWDNLKEGHREHVSNLGEQDLETVFGYLKEHFNDSKPEPKVPPHFLEGGCTPF